MIEGRVFADCYAEGKETGYFELVVDTATKKIMKNSWNEKNIYVTQAFYKIIRLLSDGEPLPCEASSTWC